jgi:hypothetical protein
MARDASSPIYQAYTVIKRDGADDWWCNIGAAFSHADGLGLNLVLQALPLDGKIVLRPPKTESDSRDERRDEGRDPKPRTNGNRPRSDRR